MKYVWEIWDYAKGKRIVRTSSFEEVQKFLMREMSDEHPYIIQTVAEFKNEQE